MHGTGTLQIGSEPAGRLAEATADVHRLRVLLEGAFDVLSGPASVLTPSLEVGGRYDGGAAETGAGLEVGGGVRYAHPAWGLTVAANGRVLLTHQDRGFREWGAGVSVRVAPGSAGRGPSLTLNSAWGNTSNTSSRAEQLWSQGAGVPGGIGGAPAYAAGGRVAAEVGYGVAVAGGALVTPYAGLALGDGGARAYRLGGRLDVGQSFSLGLEAERREMGATPEHGVSLSGTVSW